MAKKEIAVFGGGCFWCTEAIFSELRGVLSVASSYAGGQMPNPSYEQVSQGTTGHAEVIKIDFDSDVISFRALLEVFFFTHDPTTLNRQGPDEGEQYRSMVLYASDQQKEVAEQFIQELKAAKVFDKPIVTEVKRLEELYPAEAYHQDYFRKNPDQPYCQFVISPKLAKFRKKYARLLKTAQ